MADPKHDNAGPDVEAEETFEGPWNDPQAVTEAQGRDFYQKLRGQVREWAQSKAGKGHKAGELILLAPDLFHLLCRLSLDPRVPLTAKARLMMVLAYFIAPIDFLPEGMLGPAGYADDVVLTSMALKRFVDESGEELLLEHWAGDESALELIRRVLTNADRIVGSGLLKRLRKLIK